jgi:hypothetical protein
MCDGPHVGKVRSYLRVCWHPTTTMQLPWTPLDEQTTPASKISLPEINGYNWQIHGKNWWFHLNIEICRTLPLNVQG